jgi:hypothetical protein
LHLNELLKLLELMHLLMLLLRVLMLLLVWLLMDWLVHRLTCLITSCCLTLVWHQAPIGQGLNKENITFWKY